MLILGSSNVKALKELQSDTLTVTLLAEKGRSIVILNLYE